jgi:hypothetical protein
MVLTAIYQMLQIPQSTSDHQGEVAEKELITTALANKLFT